MRTIFYQSKRILFPKNSTKDQRKILSEHKHSLIELLGRELFSEFKKFIDIKHSMETMKRKDLKMLMSENKESLIDIIGNSLYKALTTQ